MVTVIHEMVFTAGAGPFQLPFVVVFFLLVTVLISSWFLVGYKPSCGLVLLTLSEAHTVTKFVDDSVGIGNLIRWILILHVLNAFRPVVVELIR